MQALCCHSGNKYRQMNIMVTKQGVGSYFQVLIKLFMFDSLPLFNCLMLEYYLLTVSFFTFVSFRLH